MKSGGNYSQRSSGPYGGNTVIIGGVTYQIMSWGRFLYHTLVKCQLCT